MAEYKVGDRVSFLNETGGGKIVRIIDPRTVMVEVEDGFEIPYLIKDLVFDFRSQSTRPQQVAQVVKEEVRQQEIRDAEAYDAARKGGLRRFAKDVEKEGIYLAFVPHEQQWLLTGSLDVVLVNHTPFTMLYSFNVKSEKYDNVDYGEVEPYSKVVVESISREDIEYWCNGVIQGVFAKDDSEYILLPLNAPFSFRSARFFKEGSYVYSGLLGEKAVMICLSDFLSLRSGDADFSRIVKEGIGSKSPAKTTVKEAAPIDKHRTGVGEAVVDLHIGELVDNILGMSSADMFNTQIKYFRAMLDSAIASEYTKVTFIHGVGNGVLKNAIIEALRNYEGTTNRMASLAKFGVGAIDVIIKDR